MTIQEKSQDAGGVYADSVQVGGSGDTQGVACCVGFAQYGGKAFGEGFDGEVVEPNGAGFLGGKDAQEKEVGNAKRLMYFHWV